MSNRNGWNRSWEYKPPNERTNPNRDWERVYGKGKRTGAGKTSGEFVDLDKLFASAKG